MRHELPLVEFGKPILSLNRPPRHTATQIDCHTKTPGPKSSVELGAERGSRMKKCPGCRLTVGALGSESICLEVHAIAGRFVLDFIFGAQQEPIRIAAAREGLAATIIEEAGTIEAGPQLADAGIDVGTR